MLDEASEDKLLDELEPVMAPGGVVVEFHTVDLFPERWFDLVLVLRADTSVLYDRLQKRCVCVCVYGGALHAGEENCCGAREQRSTLPPIFITSLSGYNEKKLNENMEAENMEVILCDARDSYAEEIVHEVCIQVEILTPHLSLSPPAVPHIIKHTHTYILKHAPVCPRFHLTLSTI